MTPAMRRVALIAAAAVLTGVLAGVVLAGGDGDNSSNDPVTTPELTVPGESGQLSDEGATGSDGASGETGPTGSSDGGGAATPPPTDQDSGGTPAPQDSQQNDVPPPPGSPADKFEKFCEQNPGACGQ